MNGNRRKLLVAVAGMLTLRRQALGQSRVPVVAVLAPSTRENEERILRPFFERMHELGWIEGRTVAYEHHYADNQPARLLELARAIVARKPDLIYTPSIDGTFAASRATSAIPIVFGSALDPVGTGLVKSLARPGGNITGTTMLSGVLASKRLELLREALPRVNRVGVVFNPLGPLMDRDELLARGEAMGYRIVLAPIGKPQELERAMAALVAQKVEVVATAQSSLIFNLRRRLIELAGREKLPVLGSRSEFADDGALLSYSGLLSEQLRRSADVVDRVLKGANPAGLPIEQDTRFQLVVNLRTARLLGLTIPDAVLLRADRVIE